MKKSGANPNVLHQQIMDYAAKERALKEWNKGVRPAREAPSVQMTPMARFIENFTVGQTLALRLTIVAATLGFWLWLLYLAVV